MVPSDVLLSDEAGGSEQEETCAAWKHTLGEPSLSSEYILSMNICSRLIRQG